MSRLLEVISTKTRVIMWIIQSRTFVIATDKSASFYADLKGLLPVLQVTVLMELRENLDDVIENLEKDVRDHVRND